MNRRIWAVLLLAALSAGTAFGQAQHPAGHAAGPLRAGEEGR